MAEQGAVEGLAGAPVTAAVACMLLRKPVKFVPSSVPAVVGVYCTMPLCMARGHHPQAGAAVHTPLSKAAMHTSVSGAKGSSPLPVQASDRLAV